MKLDSTDFRPAADQGLNNLQKHLDHTEIARQALLTQSEAISKLAGRLGTAFNDAVNRILNCSGRAVVCGMGKSGIVGKKIAATLASTGTPSFYMHPAEAFHGDLGMLTPADLIILISYSGETEEVIKLIPSLKQFGNQIIAMAGTGESTLAKHADVWLDISVDREVCPNNLAPTTSTLATMAVGDAIAVALIDARDFKPRDFAKFHPGGSLGRRLLTKVRDVMHKDVPVVRSITTVRECLFTMTRHRMGLVVVMENDELAGVLTDGDVRRALLKNEQALGKDVGEFAGRAPVTIDANCSISEAEKLMQEKKIRALIVTETEMKKVCGVLEIFD